MLNLSGMVKENPFKREVIRREKKGRHLSFRILRNGILEIKKQKS